MSEIPDYIDRVFCPDIEPIKEEFYLRNAYTDFENRRSYSYEIIKCNN